MFSYVMKGKKSKCHHLVPVGLSVLAPHVCPHPLPTGFCPCLSSQLSPVLSKLSSLRFPEPGSLAPRRHRLAAPPLSSPCTPHLTSAHLTHPRQGTMGPPPGQPSLTNQASKTVTIPPKSPKSPISREG